MSDSQLATVTAQVLGLSPLGRVRIDGATADHTARFPPNGIGITAPLLVGDRVLVEQVGSQVYVVDIVSTSYNPDTGLVNFLSAMSSGWIGYGAGYQDPAYRKIGQTVQFSGLAGRSIGAAGAGNVMGVAPVGLRPVGGTLIFPAIQTNAAGTEICGRIDMFSNGNMVMQTNGCALGGYVSLAGIRYDVNF